MRSQLIKAQVLVLTAIILGGCATPEIDRAFNHKKMNSSESNKVISEYCITCHNHREFDPENHVFDVKYRYEDKRYAGKSDCRICHTFERNWLMDARRGTIRPMKQ